MEWFDKLTDIVSESNKDNNPTVSSLMFMLSNMATEYKKYKCLGTIEYLEVCKNAYESSNSSENKNRGEGYGD